MGIDYTEQVNRQNRAWYEIYCCITCITNLMDDLQVYVLFNIISIISGQWADDYDRLWAMELQTWILYMLYILVSYRRTVLKKYKQEFHEHRNWVTAFLIGDCDFQKILKALVQSVRFLPDGWWDCAIGNTRSWPKSRRQNFRLQIFKKC